MTQFVELNTPIGEIVFINPDQVTLLKDKGDVTHVHFVGENNSSSMVAIHLPIREVAKRLAGE